MNSGKEVGKCRQLPEERVSRPFPNRLDDEIVERCAIAELLYQDAVEAAIVAKGTSNVVRIPRKADSTQVMQVVEFSFHAPPGSLRRTA